jgi:hypothetical protein
MYTSTPQQRIGIPGRIIQVMGTIGLLVGLVVGLFLVWIGGLGLPVEMLGATLGTMHPSVAQSPGTVPEAASRDVWAGTMTIWRCGCAWRDGTSGQCMVPIWCPGGVDRAAVGMGAFVDVVRWH